ncbi:hypothetical protein L1987_11610 [Smallanthus sonchifolius]|uniref:Uncharacterized protein n=1 Tax=Smallanthus sonchifolius TaxID=185202 RepID=A0ACB9JEW7_9ASTR|nr:hypothetical protein L1987_11610 [Smallanthus sonchifolius]
MTTHFAAVIFFGALISSVVSSANALSGSATTVSLTIGDSQICAITNSSNRNFNCWRTTDSVASQNFEFRSISSGLGFACGITSNETAGIVCFGTNSGLASAIQGQFTNTRLLTIAAGGSHVCGVNFTGFLICRGSNEYGQINVPDHSPFEFYALALGANHTCALRRLNNSVVCWGGGGGVMDNYTARVSFESIVAGLDFTCGLTTNNFSVICWGEGWIRNNSNPVGFELPLNRILPGPCVRSDCSCGIYPQSDSLCSGYGSICRPCDITNLVPPVPELVPPPSPPGGGNVTRTIRSKRLTRGLLAFAIVGSVGAVAGICTVIYCLWTGVCFGKKKIHNSVQPTVNGSNRNGSHHTSGSPVSRSATIRRQLSRGFRRQRSGPSSKQADKEEEFTFADLALATNDFALENKIGAGSFGVVYRGKLLDGREVAIKRGEIALDAARGRRAIFKSNEVNGGAPISLVDYAVPIIMAGDLGKILDKRVGQPEVNEVEPVELMAYTALHCVNPEGNHRPTMSDIVANLERALGLFSDSHGSISSGMSD